MACALALNEFFSSIIRHHNVFFGMKNDSERQRENHTSFNTYYIGHFVVAIEGQVIVPSDRIGEIRAR